MITSYSYMTDVLIPIQMQSKPSLRPLSFHRQPALVTTNFVKRHLKCDLKTLLWKALLSDHSCKRPWALLGLGTQQDVSS